MTAAAAVEDVMQLRLAFPLTCGRCGNATPQWLAWNGASLVGCSACKPSWGMGEVTRVEQSSICKAPWWERSVA